MESLNKVTPIVRNCGPYFDLYFVSQIFAAERKICSIESMLQTSSPQCPPQSTGMSHQRNVCYRQAASLLLCTHLSLLEVLQSRGPNFISAHELKLLFGVWEHCADQPVFALRILLIVLN